ncbi:hypothetical protein NQZ68_003413, partial [Dissostichus eleginoides]
EALQTGQLVLTSVTHFKSVWIRRAALHQTGRQWAVDEYDDLSAAYLPQRPSITADWETGLSQWPDLR